MRTLRDVLNMTGTCIRIFDELDDDSRTVRHQSIDCFRWANCVALFADVRRAENGTG